MSFLSSFMVQIKNIVLGLVFAGYLLCSKEMIFAQVNKIMNAFVKKKKLDKLRSEVVFIDKTFGKYIIGTFTDAIIVGVITAIVLSIFRMPYVPLISVLIACTNIIPILAPFESDGSRARSPACGADNKCRRRSCLPLTRRSPLQYPRGKRPVCDARSRAA